MVRQEVRRTCTVANIYLLPLKGNLSLEQGQTASLQWLPRLVSHETRKPRTTKSSLSRRITIHSYEAELWRGAFVPVCCIGSFSKLNSCQDAGEKEIPKRQQNIVPLDPAIGWWEYVNSLLAQSVPWKCYRPPETEHARNSLDTDLFSLNACH